MKYCIRLGVLGVLGVLGALVSWCLNPAWADEPSSLRFEAVELAKDIEIGYACTAADVDSDGDPDAVVVDSSQVWWFENPGWKKFSLTEKGSTKPHNICIAAADIDGDGKTDFALGTDWRPFDTTKGGDVVWLKRGEDPHKPWTVHPIHAEPTTHRIGFADLDGPSTSSGQGDGRPELINVPLMGKDSKKEENWKDRPVRTLAYSIPKDPAKDPWPVSVLDESLHVAHNFVVTDLLGCRDVLVASYDGIVRLCRASGSWTAARIGSGDEAGADNPLTKPNRSYGAGEIGAGKLADGTPFIATVEPWHGHQLAVYTPPPENKPGAGTPAEAAGGGGLWTRMIADPKGGWGHTVICADLAGRPGDEILVGWRDATQETGKPGVGVYTATAPDGTAWRKQMAEEGVHAEAVAVADFDGDKRPDILVAGRQSHNAKILFQR